MSDPRLPNRPQLQKSEESWNAKLPDKSELIEELLSDAVSAADSLIKQRNSELPFYIWWVQPEVAGILQEITSEFGFRGPEYIVRELSSLGGRPARGRLWISSTLNAPLDFSIAPVFWAKATTDVALIAQRCGGILIRKEDVHFCDRFGFVTDLQLRLIDPLTGTYTKPTSQR